LRHGLMYGQENPDFDNFLIAEVGLPPVRAFRVLITLFVIGIGPVNYWLLVRRRRLHLLLFTVPAAALLISCGLFAYGIIADGFTTYLRARSFTELDQRSHEAVTWSRMSYYAGLAPSAGLVAPDDVVFLPLERSDNRSSFHNRRVDWNGMQHLSRGWLMSRTPTQYITVRACESEASLGIAFDPQTSDCAVVNRLGTRVHHLLLCNEDGQVYLGREIAPAGRVRLQKVAKDDESSREDFLDHLARHFPTLPADAPASPIEYIFGIRTAAKYYQGDEGVTTSMSLLETGLLGVRRAVKSEGLEPRTYVALVDRPRELAIGIDEPTETQSSYVILGRW
jgi:hypothetical protein